MDDTTTLPDPAPDAEQTSPWRRFLDGPSIWKSALAGFFAAAIALAVGELVAGISARLAVPVISVGNKFVDNVPGSLKDFAIEQFDTNDKIALKIGIYVVAGLFGLVLGIAGSRTFAVGAGGIALFGAIGVWAASGEVDAPWWAGAPSVVGAIAGIAVLAAFYATIAGADRPALLDPLAEAAETDRAEHSSSPGVLARRSFLKATAGVVALATGTAAAGRALQSRFSAAASRAGVKLPVPEKQAEPIPAKTTLPDEGISPYITSNADFYRIDINLTTPQVQAETWSLKIKGMVDNEMELSYEDVLALPMQERRITLTCVSNQVGGNLVDNAMWLGTPLKDLLAKAGIQDGADQIVGRAFDGFTTGWPVANLTDGREPLLVVGMNGEPLPLEHGFPARIIVPGLYGMVSATKWLTEIELTTFDKFDMYWVERKWAAKNPIKTMARIDTPKGLSSSPAGKVAIGGVAWAQTRGITKVEVKVDDGEWVEAELAEQDTIQTWRQWIYEWDATPGRHDITARAYDTEGVQIEERSEPFPDGATGWHNIVALIN